MIACRFCLRVPGVDPLFDACHRCFRYIEGLKKQGFGLYARQLINLANVRRCRLAAGA